MRAAGSPPFRFPALAPTRLGQLVIREAATRKRRTPALRYALSTTTRDGAKLATPLWARAIRDRYGSLFSDTPQGKLALDLLSSSRLESTVSSYGSKLLLFLDFCVQTGRDPLECKELDFVEYIGHLGMRGTVHASNMQPYLSCINSFLTDLSLPACAKGTLVANARRALGYRQVPVSGDRDQRLALPAQHAHTFVDKALSLINHGRTHPLSSPSPPAPPVVGQRDRLPIWRSRWHPSGGAVGRLRIFCFCAHIPFSHAEGQSAKPSLQGFVFARPPRIFARQPRCLAQVLENLKGRALRHL